jgi:integrase/recombinase XerD
MIATRSLETLKNAFLEHLTLRNLSLLSVKQTDLAIRVFLGWLNSKGLKEITEIDREVFEDYKAWLSGYVNRKGETLANKTIIDRMCMVQRWFAWLKKKGVLAYDPIAEVKPPRHKKLLPRGVMRPDEIRKVMEQPDLKSVIGYRDRTMMEVLYSTGARAAELVGLKVPDVNLQKKMVRIRNGKGGKDRFVPLSTPCCRFLDRYLAVIRPELAAGMRPSGNSWLKKAETGKDLLFLSIYGGPMGKVWLAAMMKGYIREAGITKVVSPVHSFRHSVATHLLAGGMDVRYVQVLLGHNNINSTQIYTHVERQTLQGLLRKYHPRERARERLQVFVDEQQKAYVKA